MFFRKLSRASAGEDIGPKSCFKEAIPATV